MVVVAMKKKEMTAAAMGMAAVMAVGTAEISLAAGRAVHLKNSRLRKLFPSREYFITVMTVTAHQSNAEVDLEGI